MAEEKWKKASPELLGVATWLKKSKMRIHSGLLHGGKKVEYFKGRAAIKALLSPEYAKNNKLPPVADEQAAVRLLDELLNYSFYLRVDRTGTKTPKHLDITKIQTFTSQDFFFWVWEGSQFWNYIGGVILVLVILAGVMFPLWPDFLKVGVWYLSIFGLILLGAYFAVGAISYIVWAISRIFHPYGFWILPNLFADVGFFETFTPLYEWASEDSGKKKKKTSKKEKKGENENTKKEEKKEKGLKANKEE